MKTRTSSQDMGMPAEFWGRFEKKEPKAWVSVFKNGACIDQFNCEKDKVKETVENKYGKDATYRI